jgi:hypothetical protein
VTRLAQTGFWSVTDAGGMGWTAMTSHIPQERPERHGQAKWPGRRTCAARTPACRMVCVPVAQLPSCLTAQPHMGFRRRDVPASAGSATNATYRPITRPPSRPITQSPKPIAEFEGNAHMGGVPRHALGRNRTSATSKAALYRVAKPRWGLARPQIVGLSPPLTRLGLSRQYTFGPVSAPPVNSAIGLPDCPVAKLPNRVAAFIGGTPMPQRAQSPRGP